MLSFASLTPERFRDLEALFGPRGACGGCWCMAWRVAPKLWQQEKGVRNKAALRRLVRAGPPPGVLAYDGDTAIAWCAVAPRTSYGYLARSRVLAPVDDEPVWSISCLFVDKAYRRMGVSVAIIKAARQLARQLGASAVEAYPVAPRKAVMPDVFAWTGFVPAFRRAGFKEVARRSAGRPIMRSR